MFGMQLPAFMLKQFYRTGSLRNVAESFEFALVNPVMPATIVEIHDVSVGGRPMPLSGIVFAQDGQTRAATAVSPDAPIAFGKGAVVTVTVPGENLAAGTHGLLVKVTTAEFGSLTVDVQDMVDSAPAK